MQRGRDIPPVVAVAVVVIVLVLIGAFYWWKTRPTSGNIQVGNEEFQRRYQQMLRSSEPYNPPTAPQSR